MENRPLRQSSLNNMHIENIRRTQEYEAVMTDLALIGALPRDAVEKLTGKKIPDHLTAPCSVLEQEEKKAKK